MCLWGTNMDVSLDVNGKIGVSGVTRGQYRSSFSGRRQVASQFPSDLSPACRKAMWLLIQQPLISIPGTPFFQLPLPENSLLIPFTSTSVRPKPCPASYMAPEQDLLFRN